MNLFRRSSRSSRPSRSSLLRPVPLGAVALVGTGLMFEPGFVRELRRGAPLSATAPAPAPTLAVAPVLDFEFTDIEGTTAWLSDIKRVRAYVIVMRDVGCPVTGKYAPKIARMSKEYSDQGVAFVYLNVNESNTLEQIRRDEIGQHGFVGRYIHDPEERIGRVLGVRSTGEMFVLDSTRKLVYRGPVDDQYGITYTRPSVRNDYLKNVLDDVLRRRKPRHTDVPAEGCLLGLDKEAIHTGDVTYHRDIAPIVQQNCETCHRAGGMGPFPLQRYEDVRARREMIGAMVKAGRMPPWYAHRSVGEFANDRRLSDRDLLTLVRWIDEGAAEGNRRDAPPPRVWSTAWTIGQPDYIAKMEKPFRVPAEGTIDYQYFYVKTDFPEDRWVQALELRPGARQQVHHALVFIEEPGRRMTNRQPGDPPFQGGVNGFFAGYAPGNAGTVYPAGTAKRLPAGAWLKFQMHYTANGVAADDVTELGFIFAKEPPEREVETYSAINVQFTIPPGAPNHEVVGDRILRTGGTLLSFFPHMHVRGKAFRMELVGTDGSITPLVDVPRYDFNWQLVYDLKTPIAVDSGMRVRARGWFDNSDKNPWNPDPTKAVRHGEQSWDEMMIGYFDWIPARRPAPAPVRSGGVPDAR